MHSHTINARLSLLDLRRSAKVSIAVALTGFFLISGLPTIAAAANVDRLIQGLLGLPAGSPPEPQRAPPRQQRRQGDDGAGAVQGGQQDTVQPSFDCRRAKGAAEKTICRVPALAALDVAMAQSYAAALTAASPSADATNQLVQDQRNWRKQRDACGNRADCLQKVIFGRLQELQNPSAASAGNGQFAPAPAFSQQPDTGFNAAGSNMNQPGGRGSVGPATTQAQAAPYTADALVHPGDAGMRPQRLFLWNSLVVFNHPQSTDQESFVDLMILSIRPDYLEEKKAYNDNAAYFANRFLAPENPLHAGEHFPGHDEFEQRDARNAFLAQYTDRLRQMAPKLPFQFAYTYEFDLPEYNPGRGGFALPKIGSLHLNDTSIAGTQSGGITLRPDYDLPEPLFWPVSDNAARQAVERIRALANPMSPRRARLLAVLEATDGKAETLTIGTRLKSLAIYDDALTTELYSFDVSAFNHHQLSTSDPLAVLANPPHGIEPWDLRQVDGHPVIDVYQSDKFFGLVRLGALSPGSLDNYGEARLAEAYLTKQARNEVMGMFPDVWKGNDEFAQAQSHQTFQTRYEASIVSLAPKAPFEFSFSGEVHVWPYDSGRGAFPVESLKIIERMQAAGLRAMPDFKLPEKVDWKLPPSKAQAVLATFGESRTARMVAHVLVESVDAVSGGTRYRLDALSLYTPDLRAKLYDFPIENDTPSYLAGGSPQRLLVASPVPLDSELLCAELLAAAGAKTPESEFQWCWQTIATRDQTAYDTGAAGRTGAIDAHHPFFPRGGAALTAENRLAFLRWAAAYAAGLTDAQVIAPPSGATDISSGKVFTMLQGTTPSGADLQALLTAEHYQPDQLLSIAIDNRPLLLAFPNRASIYSSTVPLQVLVDHPAPYSARTLFKMGAVKFIANDNGRPCCS